MESLPPPSRRPVYRSDLCMRAFVSRICFRDMHKLCKIKNSYSGASVLVRIHTHSLECIISPSFCFVHFNLPSAALFTPKNVFFFFQHIFSDYFIVPKDSRLNTLGRLHTFHNISGQWTLFSFLIVLFWGLNFPGGRIGDSYCFLSGVASVWRRPRHAEQPHPWLSMGWHFKRALFWLEKMRSRGLKTLPNDADAPNIRGWAHK